MARLLLVLVVLVASGCATTPLKHYPTFPERYDASARTRVFADVAIAEDVSGSRDQITPQSNRDLAQALTDSLASWMGTRGYVVDQTYPGAVGLYLSPETVVRLREASTSADVADSAAVAPFFVDETVRADTVLLSVLDGPMGGRSPLIARTDQPEAFVLLVVRGRRVPVMKSFGQGLLSGVLSGVLTGGLVSVAVWQTSGVGVELAIVDGATGELLWRDVQMAQNDASDRTVRNLTHKLVRRLPMRG